MEVILLRVRLHDRRNTAAPGRVSRASVPDVMVLDIRDFTTFFETRAPDEVVRYLNTLWTFMVRTIDEHNGIVNKFLGDGFLAVFGATLSNGSVDCANAIAAARQIMLELDDLTSAGDVFPTLIGCGITPTSKPNP